MSFRHWLRESTVDPDTTIDVDPRQLVHDPNKTTEFMGDDEYTRAYGSTAVMDDSTISQIADLLRQIDPAIPGAPVWQPEIRNTDGSISSDAFAGTVDYASPEQQNPSRYRQMDNYQMSLLQSIPKLFPQLTGEARQLAQLWNAFRTSIVRRMQETTQPPTPPSGLRPIYYSLPLNALGQAGQVFQSLRKILSSGSPDPEAKSLVPLFSQLYKAHLQLMQKIEGPLRQQLNVARQNPFDGGMPT